MRGLTDIEFELLLERLKGGIGDIVYEGDARFDAIDAMVERGLLVEHEEIHTDGEPLLVGSITEIGRLAVRCEEAVRAGAMPTRRSM